MTAPGNYFRLGVVSLEISRIAFHLHSNDISALQSPSASSFAACSSGWRFLLQSRYCGCLSASPPESCFCPLQYRELAPSTLSVLRGRVLGSFSVFRGKFARGAVRCEATCIGTTTRTGRVWFSIGFGGIRATRDKSRCHDSRRLRKPHPAVIKNVQVRPLTRLDSQHRPLVATMAAGTIGHLESRRGRLCDRRLRGSPASALGLVCRSRQ